MAALQLRQGGHLATYPFRGMQGDGILHVYGVGNTPFQMQVFSHTTAAASQLGVGCPALLSAIQEVFAWPHVETSVQVPCADAGTAVNNIVTRAALTRSFFISFTLSVLSQSRDVS